MRDPLFEKTNTNLTWYRKMRDAAYEESQGLTDAEAISSKMAEWSRKVLFSTHMIKAEDKRSGLSSLLTLAPDHSPLHIFDCITDITRQQSLKDGFTALLQGTEHDRKNVLAWLLGQAMAKGLVDELAAKNESIGGILPKLWNLIGPQDLVHCAFVESLEKWLHKSPRVLPSILSILEAQIKDINSNPEIRGFAGESDALNESVGRWRRNASLENLWKARENSFVVGYNVLDIIPSILSIDRTSVLKLLNLFDFPYPILQVLGYDTILHDREEIAAVLKDAPICSENGLSWNGGLLALLVLQTAEKHCYELWQAVCLSEKSGYADAGIGETKKATLATWFQELGHIVMARPDGQFLSSQWLFMKVADERLDHTRQWSIENRSHEYLQQGELIEWIALALSKAGLNSGMINKLVDFPTIPDPDKLAPFKPASHDNEQTPPRLAALSIMSLLDHMTGNVSAENVQRLLSRLDALLASRDSAFNAEVFLNLGVRDLPASRCGYLLANEKNPAERWRQSWNLLIEQRRRVQHWNQTKDSDALAPSLFLLAVGTSALDWLLSLPHECSNKTKALWRELYDGVRECWLTISLRHLVECIETHIGRLFARHPLVFGDTVDQGIISESNVERITTSDYSKLLARHIGLLGGDDLMVAICCLNAYRNGVTPKAMAKVLKCNSGHAATILQQFENWQGLERQVLRRTKIAKELSELRTAIEQLDKS